MAVSHGVAKAIPAAWSEFCELYQTQWNKVRSGVLSADIAAAHFPWVSRLVEDAPLVLNTIGSKAVTSEEHANTTEEDVGAAIDWGDEPEATADLGEGAVAIQWDDDVDDSAGLATSATEKTEDAPPPSQGSSPSIDLSRAEHRIHITQELEAAQCFLQERVRQLLHDSNVAFPSSSKASSVPQWLDLDSYAQSFCPRETAVGLKLHHVLALFESPHQTIELFHMRQMYRQKEQWLEEVEAMDRVLSNAQQRNTQL
ncbi:MAG: DUF773 domain-containing protein, partial [Xanthomonadales bacterium]|nr:DUF773 domain-containing protein [Xanthomonadales bacterium]